MKNSCNELLLFIFLIIYQHSNSQNYQGIISSQIAYYGNSDLSYILSTRTDSVHYIAGDSIFYSFKTIRNNPGSSIPSCSFKLMPNWYGEKVIIQSNGTHQFFNHNNDTIHILTQADLNDTFMVFVYPNLVDTIYGWISDYDTLPILGELDTIKIIEFFHSSGLAVEPNQISISKNHGFIKWMTPYSFPDEYLGPMNSTIPNPFSFELIGTEFPKLGITKPTKFDVYNFDVGNRFIYFYGEEENGSAGYWQNTYTERTIISKSMGINEVTYIFKDTTKQQTGNYTFGPTTTTYFGVTTSVIYDNLNEPVSISLPEEFYITSNMKWNKLSLNECNLITETKVNHLLYNTDLNYPECFTDATLSSLFHLETDYVVGVGELHNKGYYFYDGSLLNVNSEIVYVATNFDTCGTNSLLSVPQLNSNSDFIIYPNPSNSNFITIQLNDQISSELVVKLYDCGGQILQCFTYSSSDSISEIQLSTENLTSGIYIVSIIVDKQTFSQKLIHYQ